MKVANGLNSSHHLFQELQSIAYCTRTHTYIPIIVEQFSPTIGFGLNSRHRLYLLNHVHEYDFVIYAEEDMLLTVRWTMSACMYENIAYLCIYVYMRL